MKTKLLLILAAATLALTGFALTETFDQEAGPALPAGWKAYGGNWTVKGGSVWKSGSSTSAFAVVEKAGVGGEVVVETSVLVRRRDAAGWGLAGVAIRLDATNYWHFALVEAPADKGARRFVELLECRDGHRGAQSDPANRLKRVVDRDPNFAWEMNHAYKLRLTLRDGRIEGVVTEPDGTVRCQMAYELKEPSVTRGAPAIFGSQFVAVFDDLFVEVAKPVAASP